MQEAADIELLQQYISHGSEEAFAALVERHVHLVYSAALRKTNNPDAAQEIAQAVFALLARKAAGLSQKTILSGWLYQTTRLTAAHFLSTKSYGMDKSKHRGCERHHRGERGSAFHRSTPGPG